MIELQGKLIDAKKYVKCCRDRDHEHPKFAKLIYKPYGSISSTAPEKLMVRKTSKRKNKSGKDVPGDYWRIDVDDVGSILVLQHNETPTQTRWIECMLFMKDNSYKQYYLFFEPWFFDQI